MKRYEAGRKMNKRQTASKGERSKLWHVQQVEPCTSGEVHYLEAWRRNALLFWVTSSSPTLYGAPKSLPHKHTHTHTLWVIPGCHSQIQSWLAWANFTRLIKSLSWMSHQSFPRSLLKWKRRGGPNGMSECIWKAILHDLIQFFCSSTYLMPPLFQSQPKVYAN